MYQLFPLRWSWGPRHREDLQVAGLGAPTISSKSDYVLLTFLQTHQYQADLTTQGPAVAPLPSSIAGSKLEHLGKDFSGLSNDHGKPSGETD